MEKARACICTMVPSKTAQELEIARYRITFCHFPVCFIYLRLKDSYTLNFLGIFHKFEDNFVFACIFLKVNILFSL